MFYYKKINNELMYNKNILSNYTKELTLQKNNINILKNELNVLQDEINNIHTSINSVKIIKDTYNNEYGSIKCNECPSGSEGVEERNTCQLCKPGYYSPRKQTKCYRCPEGMYSDKLGSTECKYCPHGYKPSDDQIDCVLCSPGSYSNNETKGMLIVLKQLFTGKIPLQNMHGVVLITKVGGDIINNDGIFYGLLLTAVISMNLAILNILPIPALDGGHLVFLIAEKIMGKPVDEEIANKIMNVFFGLLILLLIFVLLNDVYVLVKPLFIK